MNKTRLALQILLPVAVLGGAMALAHRIAQSSEPPITVPTVAPGPLVRSLVVERTDVRLDVATQGTVEPLRVVPLSPQVNGRVVATHASLREGGLVSAGDVLVEIDGTDFELAVVQREADVARAELRLLQERAEAGAAARAWRELEGDRAADPLVTRAPQVLDAEKALAGARAALERAQVDLGRTRLAAPMTARVRSAHVEVGQTVRTGDVLAELIDVEAVEVRLPVPASEAAFVDLPLAGVDAEGPTVELLADFAGARHTWTGRVVRTCSEIDRRTRQLAVIARVDAPFASNGGRPPLLVGSFVQASIHGRTFRDVVVLPRAALHGSDEVLVVDSDLRLRRRTVDVLRRENGRVVLRSGLEPGERVCLTNLELVVDGMPVRLADDGDDAQSPPK